MVAFIEPVMLLFIGVLIGGIALAVIVPIYQLVEAYNSLRRRRSSFEKKSLKSKVI